MPTKYRFVTNGDFIEFYDDAYLVITVNKNSRVIYSQYDQTAGLLFNIGYLRYQTDNVANISFDGVPLTTQGGFQTAIEAMYGENDIPAGVPTLGEVLAAGNNANGLSLDNVSLISTIAGGGIVLEAPSSARFLISIDNAGALVITGI